MRSCLDPLRNARGILRRLLLRAFHVYGRFDRRRLVAESLASRRVFPPFALRTATVCDVGRRRNVIRLLLPMLRVTSCCFFGYRREQRRFVEFARLLVGGNFTINFFVSPTSSSDVLRAPEKESPGRSKGNRIVSRCDFDLLS